MKHQEALAGFMLRKQMTQREFAIYSGLDQSTVVSLVGKQKIPKAKRLALDWLLRHGPEKERVTVEQLRRLPRKRLTRLTGYQANYVRRLYLGELPISVWASLAIRGAARRMGVKEL